ncbi:MAG: DUF362 domain-containing protein, partial [Thermoplasmata archaeon]
MDKSVSFIYARLLTGFVSEQRKIVSLVRCESYDREKVSEAVNDSIRLLGGIDNLFKSGQKIVVKPNLLRASPIEKAVTTHPEVVRAVCESLLKHGCDVLIADSPGGGTPFTERALRKSYREAGLDEVARELGAELNFDLTYKSVSAPMGKVIKRFSIIRPALEADAIVSVSKLKTHLFTYMTGATKNTFGLIPGLEKATFHSRLPEADDFSEMLVDLNELVRPRLHVMDAVIAMEGNGPNGGKTRKVGAILASESYAAIDVAACRLMSIPPADVGVVKAAIGRGILRRDLSDVWVVGENIEELIVEEFEKPKSYLEAKRSQSAVWRALGRMSRAYALRPVMVRDRCKGIEACGECMRTCPRKAIS